MERRILNAGGGAIDEDLVREFEEEFAGRLLFPDDGGYDAARSVWNAGVDRRPALIARCEGAPDVVDALNFAREPQLESAVRGGGHGAAGHAVCDGGLVIDLSSMRAVLVDARGRTARAEAGCTWAELDRATQAVGMATPGGVVSTTGIAGLTLGGGVGWLTRRRGLTCDNVRSVDLVLADGRSLTASADENAELLWGLRGGGGNFGVATAFEYELYDQGPVLGGTLVYPRRRAGELLRFQRDFIADAPWELTSRAELSTAPDGQPVAVLTLCYSGDPDQGEEALRPLRAFGAAQEDTLRVMPYVEMQSLMDPAFPNGRHNLWKSGFLRELTDEAIETLVREASPGASPQTTIALEFYGGRAALFDPAATAFPHRGARSNLVIQAQWTDRADTERHAAWTHGVWKALQPFADGSVYSNYLQDEGETGARAAFGPNLDRLRSLKRRYDPQNLFHRNHNIRP